ncbi:hypothetical protein OCOL_001727 [Ordospora colligata]|uniref:Uncharacterized protein n=1 Tax=Ordospora colligata OC4 TaxID=1354746 RepID=A0A0B2UIW4_9MICR|nr:uncharacterized protein M896_091020 [Ordospora colligata OC4]KHN69174.1 hypothetical protein M896_091020 [Ordospora colligata OC4]TBU14629.1 hypothetical protein CWI41_091010 [Ordospora colligata]TBU14823.1 hypothetical protein CWI40_091020 [Ordospora colligata]
MDEDNYTKLIDAVSRGDSIESLYVLAAVLDKIVDLSKKDSSNDIEVLSKLVEHQRLVYEKATSLYESIQTEGADISAISNECISKINELRDAINDHHLSLNVSQQIQETNTLNQEEQ